MTIWTDCRILVNLRIALSLATFYINPPHYGRRCIYWWSPPLLLSHFSQIMDVRVAFYTIEVTLRMVYTSQVILCFLLMARTTIYLCWYVDSFRMFFKIYNIYTWQLLQALGTTATECCIFHPSYGTFFPWAFQNQIWCKKSGLLAIFYCWL